MDESYLVELLVDGRPAKPGEIGRGRDHRPQQLLRAADPLPHRRPRGRRRRSRRRAPCGREPARASAGSRAARRRSSTAPTARGCPGTFFAHFFKDYEHAVRFFQVHQTEVGAITLRIVKNSQFTDAALDELLDGLRGFTGEDMEIDVEFVDEIPLGITGKRAPVVSDVALDFQQVTRTERGLAVLVTNDRAHEPSPQRPTHRRGVRPRSRRACRGGGRRARSRGSRACRLHLATGAASRGEAHTDVVHTPAPGPAQRGVVRRPGSVRGTDRPSTARGSASFFSRRRATWRESLARCDMVTRDRGDDRPCRSQCSGPRSRRALGRRAVWTSTSEVQVGRSACLTDPAVAGHSHFRPRPGLVTELDLAAKPRSPVTVRPYAQDTHPSTRQTMLRLLRPCSSPARCARLQALALALGRMRRYRVGRASAQDGVVLGVTALWWLLAPLQDDDGWVRARQTNSLVSGGFSNYYEHWGANLPLATWYEWLQHFVMRGHGLAGSASAPSVGLRRGDLVRCPLGVSLR